MKHSEAMSYRAQLDSVTDALSDEEALEVVDLYLPWRDGEQVYGPGDPTHPQTRRKFGGKLYRCRQSHVTQADWTPDLTPALWEEISLEEWPEWKQPAGAHDAYAFGAKVSHNEKHWISTMDANIFEPGVAGWDEVTD